MANDLEKFLILEDYPTDLELIKRQVKRTWPDAIFATAQSKEEFLEKLQWFNPDIILADYNIPNSNGLEILLYAREHLPKTPFIFVTGALDDEEKAAEAILRGASGYVLKDNLEKLTEKLREVWAHYIILESERELKKKRHQNNLFNLQKAIALLDNPGDEGHVRESMALLKSVLQNLKQENAMETIS